MTITKKKVSHDLTFFSNSFYFFVKGKEVPNVWIKSIVARSLTMDQFYSFTLTL